MSEGLSWEALGVILAFGAVVAAAVIGMLMRHGGMLSGMTSRLDSVDRGIEEIKDEQRAQRAEHRDEHQRLWTRSDDHDRQIVDHEGRIRRIEHDLST